MRRIITSDFPFTIMDVASLLRLNIRRRGGTRVVYADCPICGDRRGKMGLYDVLERIFNLYSNDLPKDFPGRNTALSDVIELYGDEGRAYFYCDVDGFPGVKFSPMLATWLNTGA